MTQLFWGLLRQVVIIKSSNYFDEFFACGEKVTTPSNSQIWLVRTCSLIFYNSHSDDNSNHRFIIINAAVSIVTTYSQKCLRWAIRLHLRYIIVDTVKFSVNIVDAYLTFMEGDSTVSAPSKESLDKEEGASYSWGCGVCVGVGVGVGWTNL